jgi:1-acyl-sn-glycerol-3-phosphate acyltransferase
MNKAWRLLLGIYDYLLLYLGLLWLGLLCLGWTLFATLLQPLLPRRTATRLGRYVIMAGFRVYLASLSLSRRCRFDLDALDALRSEGPLIIAPNHPGLLDAVMIISRLPNVCCIMKAELMNNVFLGSGARLAGYIRNAPVHRMIQQACQDFRSGSHLLLFPEGTRTTRQPVNPLTGSTGLISRHAGIPIQTLIIETDTPFLGKGWPLFRMPSMPIHFRVRLGRRFDPPENTRQFTAELEQYFAEELAQPC